MQEQRVAHPRDRRRLPQPRAEHAVGGVQRRIRTAQQARDLRVLRVEVAQVVVQLHGFVVAQHEQHVATGRARLPLQLLQQPECLGDLRAAVEHIAAHHQQAIAPGPAVLCVDQVVGAQQLTQDAVLAVDVRQRRQLGRHRPFRADGGSGRRVDLQRMRITAARRHRGAAMTEGDMRALHLALAHPFGIQPVAGAAQVRAVVQRGGHRLGGEGEGREQEGKQRKQGAHEGPDERHKPPMMPRFAARCRFHRSCPS